MIRGEGGDAVRRCKTHGVDWSSLTYPLRLAVLSQVGDDWHVDERFWSALQQGENLPLHWRPNTLIMQDYSGFSVIQEWRALCQAKQVEMGALPLPVHLVVDHSHRPAFWDRPHPAWDHLELEYSEQEERYRTLSRWAEELPGLNIIPPGKGVIHQVFLERLARGWVGDRGGMGQPERVLGTDSHTASAGALGIPAWGIGGTEALAVLTGRPLLLSWKRTGRLLLEGSLTDRVTAYDLALYLAGFLREHAVEGAVLEVAGPGLSTLSVPDRMVLCNMGPEYGLRQLICPPDEQTFDFLKATGRQEQARLWRAGLDRERLMDPSAADPPLTLRVDLSRVGAVVAGPGVPHRVQPWKDLSVPSAPAGRSGGISPLPEGFLALASLASCTSAGHPGLLVEAALTARNLVQKGMAAHPDTRASFFPASQNVLREMNRLRLLPWLNRAGFTYCGTACGACLGQTGPLSPRAEKSLAQGRLLRAVLSANRNFPGRLHPALSGVYLAAPARVVLWAGMQGAGLAWDDRTADDFLPDADEVASVLRQWQWPGGGGKEDLLDRLWRERTSRNEGRINRFPLVSAFDWQRFGLGETPQPVPGARFRLLMVLGDDCSTDHISPVGAVPEKAPLRDWVEEESCRRGLGSPEPLPPYGAWRLQGEAIFRGTFSSPRLPLLLPRGEGRAHQVWSLREHWLRKGGQDGFCLVAGERYGCGSARDWAAKGTLGLGIRLVLARSFESIHRRNLIAAGILPVLRHSGDDHFWRDGMILEWVGDPQGTEVSGWWVTLGCEGRGEERCVLRLRADLQSHGEVDLWRKGGWWGALVGRGWEQTVSSHQS